MKRRSFMQVVAGFLGLAAVPFVAASQPSRVPGYKRVHAFLRHRRGAHACGQIAFRLKRIPAPGELLRSSDALWSDGREITPGTLVVCGHCKQPLADFRTSDIEVEDAA